MAVNKELLKGTTSTLVLQLLSRKKMYGYDIIKELEILSSGLIEFKEGTLYPILHNLEQSEFVTSEWIGDEGSRQRKYYMITKTGKLHLKKKKEAWSEFSVAVNKIFLG